MSNATKEYHGKIIEYLDKISLEICESHIEKRKMQQCIDKMSECISMFTDQKSDLFPLGEMLVIHGGCGDGQYICEYDRKTIVKARQCLNEPIVKKYIIEKKKEL